MTLVSASCTIRCTVATTSGGQAGRSPPGRRSLTAGPCLAKRPTRSVSCSGPGVRQTAPPPSSRSKLTTRRILYLASFLGPLRDLVLLMALAVTSATPPLS